MVSFLTGEEAQRVQLLVDNQSAIALMKNPVFHGRSKHIDTKYHFIRECVERDQVYVEHLLVYGGAKGWAREKFSLIKHFMFGVMNPHAKVVQQWNQFIVISCLLAIFIDPLFFYLLSINKFRLAFISPESRVVGAGDLVDNPRKIALHYLSGFFPLDLFIVLPLPQIIVLLILPNSIASSGANYAKNLLRSAVLLQYIPRLYRFLPLLAGQSPSGFTFESAWANFVINLLTFVLAGHVVGSCWVTQCLRVACRKSGFEDCKRLIDCGHGSDYGSLVGNPTWNDWIQNLNSTACFREDGFPYGIHAKVVHLTFEDMILTRYLYSFFWGFQQISTLAGNQVPSYFEWEVLFTMGIIALGLLLFALLIGNMQTFLQGLGRRRLEMSLRRRDVEKWMIHRHLPEDLRRKVRESERYSWAATQGVNEEMLMENFPEDLQRDIRRHLFKFVKKVRIFSLMDEPFLDAICERLRQKTYVKGGTILYQGGFVTKMVFIVRGKMESIGEDGSIVTLCEGDACGEELLKWCLEHSSINGVHTVVMLYKKPEKSRIHITQQQNGKMLNKCGGYTPQQNGVAERKNRALKEMVNSMLSYSGLSEGFWGEAMLTGLYLLYRLYLVEGSRDQVGSQYSYCYSIEEDPRTYDEAMQSRDAAFWKEAIDDEIGSIMENNTWVLSDLPPGCKPLGCKWIFKRKMKVDGTIDKFKARLVIQGFRQKEGIDYFDTYAPVARITTIRLLLALAAIHNLVIHQMDVKTAFLNGDLDEEVYMKQPEGFVMPGNEHKVCKLVKSLYGLKQAPKQWHQKFDEVVLSSGFHLNQSDKCVYSKFDNSGKGVIICLYVDDMLIFGTDQNQVDKTKKFLSSRFSMKDMGEADIILGIKIKRENKGIVITQSHYIEKILKKFNREDCSPVSTPMDPVEKLKPNTGKPVDQLEYSRAIGCLMYAMTSTRPDIAYAVGRLSRFTSNPSRQHWKAITRVFKYLRGTKDYGLSYVGYPSVLEGYSDASWINHVEDSSSTSGWVFLLGGGAISWASKKQTCITSSTMESEFVALAAAGKEAEWLRNLIHEIPIWPKPIAPISIRCDSAPTMARAYSQIYNGKSRHLGVRHSMVRELIRNGVISIEFVRTQHNLADHLTKGLARDLLEIGTQVSSSRGARSKGTTYVNMKFSRFKKLGLSFLYVHQWIGTHGLSDMAGIFVAKQLKKSDHTQTVLHISSSLVLPICLHNRFCNSAPVETNAMRNVMQKFKFFKGKIREWLKIYKSKNGGSGILKEELNRIDADIDKGLASDIIINRRMKVIKSIQYLDKIHVMDLAQKAKVKWAIEGDENSRYFHGVLNKKRSQSNIRGIMVDDKWQDNPKVIKSEFFLHFRKRFEKPSANRILIDMNFPKTISIDQQTELEGAVSKEEVKKAVWDCGSDKSPGPDGFSFGFYRKFWTCIENDVFAAVNYFFTFGDIPKGCNACFIALIPKVHDANLVKDFRPISLIGSIYKIIAKILANRLVGVLGDIVNEVQSAFISDRQILDGPFILNEVIQWCKSKKKQSLIFKVDFEKAYDSVRWDFLDDVLKKFGFGNKWRDWIQKCLRSSRGSIIINGSPTEEFQFFKGLKQGDPLSPFLFILIMESLHLSFQSVVDVGLFKGIHLSPLVNLSHMFYADDAVFVGQWCDDNINTLVHVLECFFRASGLRINMSKSKIMGVNVGDDKIKVAASKLGCLILNTPFTYLGTKVGGNMSRVQAWTEIIDKVKSRLSNWKLKSLSIGGRLTLLKSVLGSIPIFHMSIFKVPLTVLRSLESIRCQFFNGHELKSNKSSWVKWNSVLAAKEKGGLGVSSLFALNRALLMKWFWRFYSHNDSFMSKDYFSYLRSWMVSGHGETTKFWTIFGLQASLEALISPCIYALDKIKDASNCVETTFSFLQFFLVLSFGFRVRDFRVISPMRSARNLQSVNLEDCVDVTDESLIAIGDVTKLTFLNLKGKKTEESDMAGVYVAKQLKKSGQMQKGKLVMDAGKIGLHVKFALLDFAQELQRDAMASAAD
ncbi:zinc finger, CCHC-type containing protein [Tanacetum coccineum]